MVLESFKPTTTLDVHWDGKLMSDLTRCIDGQKKLLDIPKIAAGTGHAMAHAVHDAFQEWGLENMAHAMCFNTTSSITGQLSRVSFWSS